MILLSDRVHAKLQGGFWKVIYSDHHTVLEGATVTVWCSELVSQKGKKIVSPGGSACFVHFVALGTGKMLRALEISTSTLLLWLRQILMVKVVFWQIHHLGFLNYGLLVYQYVPVVYVGSAVAQMFAAALLKLGLAIQQSWTIHSWANANIPITGVIRRQVSSY